MRGCRAKVALRLIEACAQFGVTIAHLCTVGPCARDRVPMSQDMHFRPGALSRYSGSILECFGHSEMKDVFVVVKDTQLRPMRLPKGEIQTTLMVRNYPRV